MPGQGGPGGRKPRLLRSSDCHRCSLHCTNPLEMPLTQSKCIPAEQTSKYQERETGALLKLLILVCASRSQSSRIKSYQMHFPSSVNGSLLTPSFLRGDCPKAHAITEQAALTIACKVLWVSQFMQTSASHQLVPPGHLQPASTISLTPPQFLHLLYAPMSIVQRSAFFDKFHILKFFKSMLAKFWHKLSYLLPSRRQIYYNLLNPQIY